MVKFINGEIVVASTKGNLVVLNQNLEIVKKFDGTLYRDPQSISGNETFIAFGDLAGVVRYYKRAGDKEPEVR